VLIVPVVEFHRWKRCRKGRVLCKHLQIWKEDGGAGEWGEVSPSSPHQMLECNTGFKGLL
jgi:hypothetical protein